MNTMFARTKLPSLDQVLRRAHLSVALIAVITVGISLTIAGTFALQSYAQQNMQLVARTLSYTLEAAVVFNDAQAAQEVLEMVGSTEDIAAIIVTDRDGKVLASWTRHGDGTVQRLESWVANLLFPEPLQQAIRRNDATLGIIELTAHSSTLIRYLLGGFLWLLVCMALSALLAVALSRRMYAGIAKPLQDLADTAHQVRQYRSFGLRAPAANIAELDQLNQDFNVLLDELASWQHHLKQENDSLSYLAQHDSLTGLCNRALLESELERAIRAARTHGHAVALMFMDGDHFKEINDTYGHATGDEVLKAYASRIQAQLRNTDILARLGGDEFAALVQPISHFQELQNIAATITQQMQMPISLADGTKLTASLTVGIAVFPDHAHNAAALLAAADRAMYRAKEQRRGSWALANTLH